MTGKNYKTLTLDPKYVPKKSEKYMCIEHKAYFYQLLNAQKEELLQESVSVLNAVKLAEKNETAGVGDELDNSTAEQEIAMNLKLSERNHNLLKKIETALERLENGTYGYSIVSGEEIGISRMLASPFATLTIEEKDESERRK
ncbi:MAG TPA: RNA polymerase-binding protein DksA [Alphaproteobacteria bacterium]|nr:RNA polymerase-binding protein DksA [Alphaproteobacteria bacterium]